MPSQVFKKDAPVSSHEKAILSGTPSLNDMHPNSFVTTESSSYDKEYASLERIFTDMVFANHESSGKNQTALTNKHHQFPTLLPRAHLVFSVHLPKLLQI